MALLVSVHRLLTNPVYVAPTPLLTVSQVRVEGAARCPAGASGGGKANGGGPTTITMRATSAGAILTQSTPHRKTMPRRGADCAHGGGSLAGAASLWALRAQAQSPAYGCAVSPATQPLHQPRRPDEVHLVRMRTSYGPAGSSAKCAHLTLGDGSLGIHGCCGPASRSARTALFRALEQARLPACARRQVPRVQPGRPEVISELERRNERLAEVARLEEEIPHGVRRAAGCGDIRVLNEQPALAEDLPRAWSHSARIHSGSRLCLRTECQR